VEADGLHAFDELPLGIFNGGGGGGGGAGAGAGAALGATDESAGSLGLGHGHGQGAGPGGAASQRCYNAFVNSPKLDAVTLHAGLVLAAVAGAGSGVGAGAGSRAVASTQQQQQHLDVSSLSAAISQAQAQSQAQSQAGGGGGGAQGAAEFFAPMCRADALVSALQLSSQLARHSEKFYAMLSSIFTAPKLVWMLTQRSRVARAKCCNLVGNLCRYVCVIIVCSVVFSIFNLLLLSSLLSHYGNQSSTLRHSGKFYPILAKHVHMDLGGGRSGRATSSGTFGTAPASSSSRTVLGILSAYCADDDPSTRKFASFAGVFLFCVDFFSKGCHETDCLCLCLFVSSFLCFQWATPPSTPRSCTLCCRAASSR
jgi:hypothetical protein